MNSKAKVKYLAIYLLLNVLGILLAFQFWWTDSLTLSKLNRVTFILLLSVGICWIGILFLSILISRCFIVKLAKIDFISPIDLISNNYFLSEIGLQKAKKLKRTITLTGFSILFLTILSFRILMKIYENNELKKHSVLENVVVKKINYDIKKNSYVFIEYKQKQHNTNLRLDYLKLNDTILIIYSKKNPKIIKTYNEYLKSVKEQF